jgi:tetratricopeptide (TPR) repeat protein
MALPAQTLPGSVIGHYQILGEVGAGGMGVVFKAFDTKLQRTVALKFLSHNPDCSADRNRLLHEARAASTLDHKNIAAVHSVEEADDGQLFIVMAYYDGVSLAARMRTSRLSTTETVRVVRQIAEGLGHAHLHNLVHRDVKPSNVILTSENEAKIVDFGLARFVSAGASTQTLSISGTLSYISPEQLSGKAVDARTDIWSLGVIAYELLTSRLPFHGETPASTINAILQAPPPEMGDAPQVLQAIVLRALAKKVEERYQSCNELLRDLSSLDSSETHSLLNISGDGARIHFVSRSHLAGSRWLVRNRRTMGLIAALLLAITLGVLAFHRAWMLKREHPTEKVEASNPAAYESYLQGLEYLDRYDKAENLNEAIRLFEITTKADPKFALAFSALGDAYWDKYRQDGDPRWVQVAAAACQRAAQLNDQLPAVYVTLGRIHDGTGRHDLAFQEFQRALELDHRNADALLGLADAYSNVGRFVDAEETFKKACAMRPENWDGYYRLGAFYFRQSRFADSAIQFRRVIEFLPDHMPAHTSLGTALMSLGQNDEAEREFRKALAISPGYPAFTNLGVLYYKQKRFAESAAMWEQALRLNDKDYRLWNNLAIAYEWLGNHNRANDAFLHEFALLKQTLLLQPDDPEVRANLGVLYSQKHERNQALSHLEAALALSPEDPEILNKVGEAYENLGERSKALEYFLKAMRKGLAIDDMKLNPDLRPLLSDPAALRALREASRPTASLQPPANR